MDALLSYGRRFRSNDAPPRVESLPRSPSRQRGASTRTLLSACFFCFGGTAASGAEPTLADLASQLRETLSGINTVEMHYRQTLSGQGPAVTSNCEWIRDGDKTRLIMHAGELPGGWWSFDGRHGYSIEHFANRPQDMRGILKTSSAPEMIGQMYAPGDWLGLRLATDPPAVLTDLVAQGQSRIAAAETFDGLPAYRLDLGVHDRPAEGAWAWSAVVCPGKDGLPVEISCVPSETNPDFKRLSSLVGRVRFAVSEFRSVNDSALHRERWLPWKMSLEIAATKWDLEASSARVNHVIPAAAYVPQPQPGTEIVDITVPGKRKVRIHKPEAGLAKQVAALAKETRESPAAAPGRGPVASPPDPMFWPRTTFWAGALCLFAAAVVYVVHSRRGR